jgi:probable blue pigment (indigoidine) exporter
MNRRLIAITQASSVIILSSFASVLAKLALRDVPPFTFVWLQIAIGGSLVTLYTFWLRRERIPKGLSQEVWAYIIWIGIGNFTIVRVLFMLSLDRLPATTNVYLISFVGIVTMLMSIFVLRERPSVFQILGAAIAISGLRVFFREIPPPSELVGVIYVAIGVLALASTNNIARKLAMVTDNRLANNVISTIALWIGGLPVVLFGLASDWPPAVSGWTNWGIIALSAVVAITIGPTVWNFILRTLRSYEASILAGSSVIYTALFAVPILGERLSLHQIAGIVLMLVGLFLVQVRRGLGRGIVFLDSRK